MRETTVLPENFSLFFQDSIKLSLFHFYVCKYTLFYYRILLIITGPECYDTNVPTATKVI